VGRESSGEESLPHGQGSKKKKKPVETRKTESKEKSTPGNHTGKRVQQPPPRRRGTWKKRGSGAPAHESPPGAGKMVDLLKWKKGALR